MGGSILMISAPITASCRVQYGAAYTCPRSITRIPSSGRLIGGTSSQKRARDHHPMHLAGAFADSTDSRLAIPSLDRKFLADAVAAVNLPGAIDYPAEHFARVELRDRRLGAEVLAAVGLPRAL